MRQSGILLLILFLLGFSFESCEKVTFEKIIVSGDMSFTKDIIPIFSANCVTSTCHGGSKNPDLRQDTAYHSLTKGDLCDTTNSVNDSKLIKRLLEAPHSSRILPEERDKIILWIRQGKKRN